MYLEQNNKNKLIIIALLGLVAGGILMLVMLLNRPQTYQTPASGLAGTRSVVCRWDASKIPSNYAVVIQLIDNQQRVIRAIPNPSGSSFTFEDVSEGSFPTTCHLDLIPNQAALEACVYKAPVTCVNIPTATPTSTPSVPTNTPTPAGPTITPGGPTLTPTDVPTSTPRVPTNTPTSTPRVPTNTPAPTNTPVPLPPTSTPRPGGPTSTPAPTNTPVPLAPTNTPVPPQNPPAKLVNPPAPTNTPVPLAPTSTPRPGGPTSTPAPTNTPVPVAPSSFPELPKAGINAPTILIVAMGVIILLLAFAL